MSIDQLISSADIVVFEDPYCPYCIAAKQALTSAGHKFALIAANSGQRSELRTKTKVSSVPSIWVKGIYVGGCNDGPQSWMGIKKMIASGKLNELLNK